MAEEEQVQSSAEETTEVDETSADTSETTEAPSAEELTDLRKKASAFEDQRKRAEKAEADLKKLKGQAQPNKAPALSADDQKRLDRIELNSLGVKDREEQDFVLGAAKRLGVDPSEAASDPIVSGKLEAMREVKKTKEATPAPSRSGQSTQNVSRLAEKALSTGELPTDPDVRAKVREEMKRLTRKG